MSLLSLCVSVGGNLRPAPVKKYKLVWSDEFDGPNGSLAEPDAVQFYADATRYATFTPESPGGGPWVFDHPFFIILNVAVGGDWPGSPDANTQFPQTMLIDYVRVYPSRSKLRIPEENKSYACFR